MTNNRPLMAHLCLFFACAFWGLMAPLGKDAMTHGFTGIEMVTFRVTGGAVLFWLTSLFTPKVRTCDQPVLLYDGSEHHLAHKRQHRDHVNAHLRHDSGIHHTERAHHRDEGRRRGHGLHRGRDTDSDKRSGRQLESGQHLRRPAVPGRPVLIRPVPVTLQQAHTPLFGHNGQQMDVYIRNHNDTAVHRRRHRFNQLRRHTHRHMARNRIRRNLRHIHQLYPHDDRAADAAPHRGERLQLRAAGGFGNGQRDDGAWSVQADPGSGRHPGMSRSVAGDKIKIACRQRTLKGPNIKHGNGHEITDERYPQERKHATASLFPADFIFRNRFDFLQNSFLMRQHDSYPTGCGTQPETVSKIKVRRTGRRKVTFLPPKGYLLPPKTLSFASPKTTFCDITDSQAFTRRAEGIVHVSEIMVGQHVRHWQTTTCKMI